MSSTAVVHLVFVVEGEKDVDRLKSIGLTATTRPGDHLHRCRSCGEFFPCQVVGQTVNETNNYGLSRVISRDNSNKSSFPALTALVYEPGL